MRLRSACVLRSYDTTTDGFYNFPENDCSVKQYLDSFRKETSDPRSGAPVSVFSRAE